MVSSNRTCAPPTHSRHRWAALLAVLLLFVLSGCGRGEGQGPDDSAVPLPDPALNSGVVRTESGAVRGLVAPDHLLFQGIPYAAPPVGELRWQLPAPRPAWEGTRDASKPGPRCIQDSSLDPGFSAGISEDCLSVNVWSPTDASGLPVMVWIHGGAFVNGSADLYNAQRLATQGRMIVVTVNYRLGALGFLAHPALGPPGQVGNYGLADQQAALRWVRDNIAGFGGDASKVTLAGESAGGMSVCDHMVAPGSAGLFRSVIIQSGPCQAQLDLAAARQPSLDYAESVGCPDPATALRCLRDLPAAALEDPTWYYHIGEDALSGPITGSSVLPVDPMVAMAGAGAGRLPVLIGTNRDEFTLFVAMQYIKLQRAAELADYPDLLAHTFGRDADAVGERYPVANYDGNVSAAYSAAVTDGAFACVADQMGDDLAEAGAPVYAYEFNDPTAPAPESLRAVPFPVGASHSLELQYLFDVVGSPPLDPRQQRLSEQMIGYWSQFVHTGVPSAPGAPEWPRVNHRDDSGVDGPRMSFDADGSRVSTDFERIHQCGFWAGVQPR